MAKSNEPREPKKGDKITLVLANGQLALATITGVNKNGTVDLESGAIVITNSPRDDSRLLSDSWAFLAEEPKADAKGDDKKADAKGDDKKADSDEKKADDKKADEKK
jgi:hypothetical protein